MTRFRMTVAKRREGGERRVPWEIKENPRHSWRMPCHLRFIFRFVSFSVKIKIIGGNKSCLFLKGLECCFPLELCLLSVQAIENTEIKSCDNTAYVILTKASLHFL